MFGTYFELGFDHILDLQGYDHILFVIALCAVYSISQWRQILILVTAFTIGHCLTLVLSGLQIVNISADLIEFLIPLTILITAIFNIVKGAPSEKKIRWNYLLALAFGLIHGLGFSNYFKALVGKEENIVQMLLPFNLGVELGQLVIVAATLLAGLLFMNLLQTKQRDWNLIISGAAAGIAITLMIG